MTNRTSTWEALSANSGIVAVLVLTLGYAISAKTVANPDRAGYAGVLMAERMKWELLTLVRLVGGVFVLWFAGTHAGRLRAIEGEPGRLAGAAFGPGVVWAGVWLLSAMFNSTSIEMAAVGDDAGARLAGLLARNTPLVLTASVMFTILLPTALVALRHGGFPSSYAHLTAALSIVFLLLAILDWYSSWNLSPLVAGLSSMWVTLTSVLPIRETARAV